MLKNFIQILLLLIAACLASCQHQEKTKLKKTLDYYATGLIAFDANLKNHFPFEFESGEIQDMSFVLPSIVKKGGCSVALLRIKTKPDKFNRISKEVRAKNELIETLKSDNIITLPDSSDNSGLTSPIIIPDFSDLFDSVDDENSIDFKKRYDIYLIDTKNGNFTSHKQLKKKPYLPDGWEHGYSRGIGIDADNQGVIYWLIIW